MFHNLCTVHISSAASVHDRWAAFKLNSIHGHPRFTRYIAVLRASLAMAPCAGKSLVHFGVVGLMYSCLHGQSLRYLTDLCIPVSDVSTRQHLRPATRRFWWFPDAGSTHGPSLWPKPNPNPNLTLYQTAWEFRILSWITSDVC